MDVWPRLSVVLITLNEEDNLSRCLARLPKGVTTIVLDSGSTDKTEQIARQHGAQFHFRTFDNYAAQKNAALAYAKSPWLLSLDADEELTDDLIKAIEAIIARNLEGKTAEAFRVNRRLVFLDRELRYGKSADDPVRLFTKDAGAFSGVIHESFVLRSGVTIKKISSGHLKHHSYKNLTDYFERFNRYTSRIAENHVSKNRRANFTVHVLRPWFEFISRYFFRLGFLDGYPGYTYALISSLYTFIKYAKLFELRHQQGSHGKSAHGMASHLQSLE